LEFEILVRHSIIVFLFHISYSDALEILTYLTLR